MILLAVSTVVAFLAGILATIYWLRSVESANDLANRLREKNMRRIVRRLYGRGGIAR